VSKIIPCLHDSDLLHDSFFHPLSLSQKKWFQESRRLGQNRNSAKKLTPKGSFGGRRDPFGVLQFFIWSFFELHIICCFKVLPPRMTTMCRCFFGLFSSYTLFVVLKTDRILRWCIADLLCCIAVWCSMCCSCCSCCSESGALDM